MILPRHIDQMTSQSPAIPVSFFLFLLHYCTVRLMQWDWYDLHCIWSCP